MDFRENVLFHTLNDWGFEAKHYMKSEKTNHYLIYKQKQIYAKVTPFSLLAEGLILWTPQRFRMNANKMDKTIATTSSPTNQ